MKMTKRTLERMVRRALRDHGGSISELAKNMQAHDNSIRNWLTGRVMPNANHTLWLATRYAEARTTRR